jgi:hypothetical protein
MNPGGGGESDLERRLERELARSVRSLRPPSPAPSQAAYHRVTARAWARSLLPAVGAVAVRSAALVIAAGLVAAGGAVAATGSVNPTVWSSTATRVVATCKGALPSGQRAIGPCVSAEAEQSAPPAPVGPTPTSPTPSAPATNVPAVAPTPAIVAVPPTAVPQRQGPNGSPSLSPTSTPAGADHARGAPLEPPGAHNSDLRGKAGREPSPSPSACPSPPGSDQPASSKRGQPTAPSSDQQASTGSGSAGHGAPDCNSSPSPTPSPPRAH